MAKKTNCVINGTPYYRIRATIGHKTDGKPIIKPFYGSCKSEAEEARDEYINELKAGLLLSTEKSTVGQAFKIWLYEVKRVDSDLKATSFCRYETAYRNHIYDTRLMTLMLSKVTSLDVQRCLNELSKKGKPYSTIRESLKVLKMFFNYATDAGYIAKYPCKNVKIPGERPKERKIDVFTDTEIDKIKSSLKDHRLRFLILLALGTGMRKGELLALHYEDILDTTIHVHRSLASVTEIEEDASRNREMKIWEPKSQDSNRKIPMPKELLKELALHKRVQAEERLHLGLSGRSALVFTTVTGNLLDDSNVNRAYKRILKSAGVPDRKFHTLRHTYATKLLKNGVDVKTVQELMGHSDITITMVYLHPDMTTKELAAESLNQLFQ